MPPLRHWLSPGTPDDARAAIQPAVVDTLIKGYRLRGWCLNAGAGEGMYARTVDRQPGITHAIDIDLGQPCPLARSRVHHAGVRGNLQQIPLRTGTFDCAFCTEVLEHVPDDRAAVRELARVLKPGAILIVTVPTPPAPPDRAHVREGYDLDSLTRLLDVAGFTVERHAWCFHGLMRGMAHTWAAMPTRVWAVRRLMPRALFSALGRLDARLRIGRPWNLAVVARRRVTPPAPAADARSVRQ